MTWLGGADGEGRDMSAQAASARAQAVPAGYTTAELYPPGRLAQAAEAAARSGLDALLLTPGPDLRYLTGYDTHQSERLTCLAVPAHGPAFLVVPRLELASAQGSPAAGMDLEFVVWDETGDPYSAVAQRLGDIATVGLAGQMWALMVLRFRDAMPGARQALAATALRGLRIRKTPAEVAALAEAGAAIDRVHAAVPQWLRPGRTEREAAADIASAIAAAGHARIDFVIVGSGPNAAKPHHEPSDRVLSHGDAVVVDIGGTMPSGYCSDCTRTYAIGAVPPGMARYYEVLREAQEAACAAVGPGVRAAAVDAVARDAITAAGHGEHFTHRTGHGIGLETHEDPYIVAGNAEELEPGMVFSVEPGIYPGPDGARIEDIVVCTPGGHQRLNNASRDLIVAGA